jgi:hypothetical protein
VDDNCTLAIESSLPMDVDISNSQDGACNLNVQPQTNTAETQRILDKAVSLVTLKDKMEFKHRSHDSVMILCTKNVGKVAEKAKSFNGVSYQEKFASKIPIKIVNKEIGKVQQTTFEPSTPVRHHQMQTKIPRSIPRSISRLPARINKRCLFKASSRSPLMMKTIRQSSRCQRAKLLKPEIMCARATPKRFSRTET